MNRNKLCSDVICERDQYCFVPELGIAQCLKKPINQRQNEKTKIKKLELKRILNDFTVNNKINIVPSRINQNPNENDLGSNDYDLIRKHSKTNMDSAEHLFDQSSESDEHVAMVDETVNNNGKNNRWKAMKTKRINNYSGQYDRTQLIKPNKGHRSTLSSSKWNRKLDNRIKNNRNKNNLNHHSNHHRIGQWYGQRQLNESGIRYVWPIFCD